MINIFYPLQLTKVFDGEVALVGIQDLPVDVWDIDTVTKHVATDQNILFCWGSPADQDGVCHRSDIQGCGNTWHT